MDKRTEDVNKLRFYTEEIDKDLTMILQSLQWNRKHILEHPTMVSCKYDSNHQILADSIVDHQQKCLLRRNGYVKEDQLLPDPLSTTANTLIKLSKEDIAQIIKDAANSDPTFIKVFVDTCHGPKWLYTFYIIDKVNAQVSLTQGVGVGSVDLAPQTLRRLQCTYSMDERRAIHDAVVAAAPACHDLTDLALPSVGENDQEKKTKSRTEILAELRDMRRRRTKYRVAAKSRNYSDVLRDVIKTQLEMYNEVLGEIDKKPDITKRNVNKDKQTHPERNDNVHAKVDKKIREDNREVSKRDRDRDNEKYTSEKPNKDKSSKDYRHKEDRNDEGSDRRHRHRNSSLEMRVDKRHNSDHKTRDKDRNRRHRSRSRERHSDRSKESRSDGRSDYRAAGKHDRQHSREYKERDRIREHERYRHGDKNEHRDLDTDRARSLLTQIKREIDSGDEASDVPNNREKYETCVEYERSRHEYNNVHLHPDTAQIQTKREMESGDEATDVSNNRDTYRTPIEKKVEKDRNIFEERSGYESNSHSHSNSFYSHNRSKDRNTRDRNTVYRRHTDKRESDLKYYRDEHKRNYRDGSYDREAKRSLVEKKHRAYSEIYAELERQRNKKS